jgi:hypothetical protein
MEENYRIIPKKEPITFPKAEVREDQYDQPIGPVKPTTAERIASAARSAGTSISGTARQFITNPTVQKAGHFAKERAEVFQHNISLQQPRQQPQQPQQPPRQQPSKLQHKYKPQKPTGQVRAVQPPPQRLAAQEDPFGVGAGGHHDDPLGRGFVPLNRRSGHRQDDDPFGLRR